MTEPSGVIAWASTLLSGIAPGGVHASLAPQVSKKPDVDLQAAGYIILSGQSYNEIGTSINGTLAAGDFRLMVKAVTQSAGFLSAETIYEQAHAAIQGQTGFASGVIISSCIRTGIIPSYAEVKDGIRYNHYGGIYCVISSPF